MRPETALRILDATQWVLVKIDRVLGGAGRVLYALGQEQFQDIFDHGHPRTGMPHLHPVLLRLSRLARPAIALRDAQHRQAAATAKSVKCPKQ